MFALDSFLVQLGPLRLWLKLGPEGIIQLLHNLQDDDDAVDAAIRAGQLHLLLEQPLDATEVLAVFEETVEAQRIDLDGDLRPAFLSAHLEQAFEGLIWVHCAWIDHRLQRVHAHARLYRFLQARRDVERPQLVDRRHLSSNLHLLFQLLHQPVRQVVRGLIVNEGTQFLRKLLDYLRLFIPLLVGQLDNETFAYFKHDRLLLPLLTLGDHAFDLVMAPPQIPIDHLIVDLFELDDRLFQSLQLVPNLSQILHLGDIVLSLLL